MKKFLFSAIACGLLTTLASCQNQDEPQIPGTAETSFPKDSKSVAVNVEIPEEIRTRAEGDTDLPLWGVHQSPIGGKLTVRYGIYYNDGSMYFNSDELTAPVTTYTSNFNLTIPLPANQETMRIFVWADKDQAAGYKIDWTNMSVTCDPFSEEGQHLFDDFAISGDAFCYWGEIGTYNDNHTLTLKRPFVQVNILTDELFGNESLANKFINTGIGSSFALYPTNEQDNTSIVYLPKTWYWDSDTFDMVAFNRNEEQVPNACFRPGPVDYFVNPNEAGPCGTVNGKKKQYLGVFYVFAPRERKGWKNEQEGNILNRFVCDIFNGEGTDKTSNVAIAGGIGEVKANERYIIHNDCTGSSGGILTNNVDFKFIIDGDYDNNNEPFVNLKH